MDPGCFDTLARSLSDIRSRRALTRLLGGVALSGPLALLGVAGAEAKRNKKKKKKKRASPLPPPPPPACGAGGPCLVFLSSTLHSGNLGGLSGADATCQGLATAAGLPGTYKAWLSDSTSAVSSRFVPSPGPYQLVNGTTIAANWADLRDGTLLAPINVTETGGDPGGNIDVWTGTLANGNAGPEPNEHCANWSTGVSPNFGRGGFATRSNAEWTSVVFKSCSYVDHLYCFQQR